MKPPHPPKALATSGVKTRIPLTKRIRRKRRRCDECGASVVDDRCALCESNGRAADVETGDYDDLVGP